MSDLLMGWLVGSAGSILAGWRWFEPGIQRACLVVGCALSPLAWFVYVPWALARAWKHYRRPRSHPEPPAP